MWEARPPKAEGDFYFYSSLKKCKNGDCLLKTVIEFGTLKRRRGWHSPLNISPIPVPGFVLITATNILFVFLSFSYIKLSSPNLNNLIILGCVLIYVSVYMIAIDGRRVDTDALAGLCMVRIPSYLVLKTL